MRGLSLYLGMLLIALGCGLGAYVSEAAPVGGSQALPVTLFLNEGFEGTAFPPENWTATASSWARTTSSPLSGSASAAYAAGGNVNGKQLRTPKLNVTSSSPALSFKARRGSSDRGEQLRVGYSANASGPWTYLLTFTLSSAAAIYSQPLSSLAPGAYYFVLETLASNTGGQNKTFAVDDLAGPALAGQASLNLSSWAAGDWAPGEEARSGQIFILSNLGGSPLSVTAATGLAGTEFSTDLAVPFELAAGATRSFGCVYAPLDYGSDAATLTLATTGGAASLALSGSASHTVLAEGFEGYADFSLSCSPWAQYDGDQGPTYTVSGVTFPNQGYIGSYLIFNPSACEPSQVGTNLDSHQGAKYAACFDATSASAPNDDWLISPQFSLNSPGQLSFWARSRHDVYGLELFRVLYSTSGNTPASFTAYLAGSAATQVEAPAAWTLFSYSLPQNTRYIAIQCVSYDSFAFLVDDIRVSEASSPQQPVFGHLSGYVRPAGTSLPLAGALVQAGTKQAVTDAAGHYLISNLPAGSLEASCSAVSQYYHPSAAQPVTIPSNATANLDFGLTWGELAASPATLNLSLYPGQSAGQTLLLSNPGGTAPTLYSGCLVSANGNGTPRGLPGALPGNGRSIAGGELEPLTGFPDDRATTQWFGYAGPEDADFWSALYPERGNFFRVDDLGMVDGGVTISQLRHYFFNPMTEPWGSTYNKFNWKIYSVDGAGNLSLLHTSAQITLPADTPLNSVIQSLYTLPTPVTVPAGCNFLVSIAPSSSLGRPHSIVASEIPEHGYYLSGGAWTSLGMTLLLDAYVSANVWLSAAPFSGSLAPGGSVSLPLQFSASGLAPGVRTAWIEVVNDARYPDPAGRGEIMSIPVILNVADPAGPPPAPLNVRLSLASPGGNLLMAWDPVTIATGYYVYAGASPNGTWQRLRRATSSPTQISAADLNALGIDPRQAFFRVTADTAVIPGKVAPAAPPGHLSVAHREATGN